MSLATLLILLGRMLEGCQMYPPADALTIYDYSNPFRFVRKHLYANGDKQPNVYKRTIYFYGPGKAESQPLYA